MFYRCDGGTERRLVECNPALCVILLPPKSREISNTSRRSRSIFAVLQNFLCLFALVLLVHCVYPSASYYPHMPIGKVWMYRLFFVCFCVFILCTVTNFFAEDKASGVKFYTVVHRRLGQGISQFGELPRFFDFPSIS